MQTVSFNIGDAFPASEPVARFITVVAMMSNDWQRLTAQMEAIEDFHRDAEGLRMMSFRQQIALHHEAITFIETAVTVGGSPRSKRSLTVSTRKLVLPSTG